MYPLGMTMLKAGFLLYYQNTSQRLSQGISYSQHTLTKASILIDLEVILNQSDPAAASELHDHAVGYSEEREEKGVRIEYLVHI
jgi:hypothetical protein